MTSERDPHGADPHADRVDPAYDALFRPGGEPDAPQGTPMQQAPEHEAPTPPATSPGADTGRLFRSQGVQGHDETVLALESGRFSRLRTLDRDAGIAGAAESSAPAPVHEPVPAPGHSPDHEPTPEDAAVASLLAPPPAPVPSPMGEPVAASDSRRRSGRRARGAGSAGLRAGGVYLIVLGVTLIVGFANALLGGGALGWPTGIALLISSVYAAIKVRPDDDSSAFLIPPIAFLAAALTAGQLFLDAGEGSFLNRIVIAFFALADNWVWILGSTLIALVIVLVRRRRS